jgi:voltage-gated potassium channel Kch
MNLVEHKAHTLDHELHAAVPSGLPFRKWLYSWLMDPDIRGNHQKNIDRWIAILIVANLFALLFEHVPAVFEPNKHLFHAFDLFSVIVFTAEYFLRLYLAPEDHEFKGKKHAHLRYISSPFALIDLLAIAPFYLQAFFPVDLRMLRFLRLLRILKLFRVLIPALKDFLEINQQRTFRQKIHALVFPSEYGGNLHSFFDTFIAIWVVISVVAVVLESVMNIHYILDLEFIILDAIAVGIFTLEYCMRIYCCVEDPRYQRAISGRFKQIREPSSLIDLMAIVPFFLEVFLHHLFDLRFLRVFRLLRLLKLTRYTGATKTLTKVIAREWPVLAASAFVMMLLVVLTASLGYLFEHEAQPEKFENIPQSIYWAVITLASVGYGDISPVTPMGRVMTIILALLGIGIFAIPAALLSSAFSDQLRIEREALKTELHDMLSDGVLSLEETEKLFAEAKRLHLSDDDVNRLIEKVRRDFEEKEDVSVLPLHKIAATPEHAVEHFKSLVSQIRQLSILTDLEKFEASASKNFTLTPGELNLWRHLQVKPPSPP